MMAGPGGQVKHLPVLDRDYQPIGPQLHSQFQQDCSFFCAASNAGRRQRTGEQLNYRSIFDAIEQAGYEGYFNLEYWPLDAALDGLSEVAAGFA
ncbi:MAG: hypothetical protein MI861_07520 [Pirellulales bacterium]|nr:hypothetical protein [Pirellulales bacterium]